MLHARANYQNPLPTITKRIGAMATENFEIIRPRAAAIPLIAHVPHASTEIPSWLRSGLLLDEAEIQSELIKLTDWHTCELFSWVADLGGSIFVNNISRLVFDPERFVDDEKEPMAKVGQGAFYVRTSDGKELAAISAAERAERVRRLYEPYHKSLADLVGATLRASGIVLLLDCHSFATIPLPSEPSQAVDRPDICIGTDPFHTPESLAQGLCKAFEKHGLSVELDKPFAGTLVPMQFLGSDDRVVSVMIEVRRGLYCDERTGKRNPGFMALRETLKEAVESNLLEIFGRRV
jgi:N-formylglutamate amidohydrolase